MSGVAQPVGDAVEFAAADPSGCRVDLRLIGPYLAAKDNGQCGGGARFAGVFRKPSAVSFIWGGSAKSGGVEVEPQQERILLRARALGASPNAPASLNPRHPPLPLP